MSEQIDRRKYIGSSDAAPILGVSPFRTPFQTWMQKTGQTVDAPATAVMKRGIVLEPTILAAFAEESGLALSGNPQQHIRHARHEFIGCTIDETASDDCPVEAKSAASTLRQKWGEPGSGDVPEEYWVQGQHILACKEAPHIWIPCLFVGFTVEFGLFKVERDAEFIGDLVAAERKFWECVQSRVAPEPRTLEDMKARWPKDRGTSVEASSEIVSDVDALRAITENIKNQEEGAEVIKARIQGFMGDNSTLTYGGNAMATWKAGKPPRRFDLERFRTEQPELAAQYMGEGTASRRFLLKGGAE